MTTRPALLTCLVAALVALASCGDDGGGDSADAFCAAVPDAKVSIDKVAVIGDSTSPAEIEATFTGAVDAVKDLQAVAPDALAEAFGTMVSTVDRARQALAANDWDVAAAAEDTEATEAFEAMESQEMTIARAAIDSYSQTNCGISLDDTTESTIVDESGLARSIGENFAEGAGVQLDEAQQRCVGQALLDEFGFDGLTAIDTASGLSNADLQRVVSAFDDCELSLGDLTATDGTGLAGQFGKDIAANLGLTLTAEQEQCLGGGLIDALPVSRLVEFGQEGATPTDDEIAAVQAVFVNCGISSTASETTTSGG